MACLCTTGSWGGCCPEEVAVTINNNSVEIGDSTLQGYAGNVSMSTTTMFQLPHVPLVAFPVTVIIGGVPQREGIDFVIDGGSGVLKTPTAEASIYVSFSYLSNTAVIVASTPGTIQHVAGTFTTAADVPEGLRILDGGALQGAGDGLGYLAALYPAAFARIGYSFGGSGDYFATQVAQQPLYIEGTLVPIQSFFVA